jgi:hypothetical protein
MKFELPPLPGHVVWNPRDLRFTSERQPKIGKKNRDLHAFLIEVCGRYVACLTRSDAQPVQFEYDVLDDSPGFLKLDLEREMLVVGCVPNSPQFERFMAYVPKAYYIATEVKSGDFFRITPVVIFGERSPYVFYIESLRGFGRVAPYFIEASHQFVARQILPGFIAPNEINGYIAALRRGEDNKGLLRLEPLMRALLGDAPESTRSEMIRQIGDDVAARMRG